MASRAGQSRFTCPVPSQNKLCSASVSPRAQRAVPARYRVTHDNYRVGGPGAWPSELLLNRAL